MMLFIIAAFLAALACLAAVVRQLCRASAPPVPTTTDWLDELSAERYRPMLRLLDQGELDFLRAQPGFTPAMAARLRIQRCQIFRGYLQCMETDFRSVCMALKCVVLSSGQDRPDLTSALLRRQLIFRYRAMLVRLQVVLYQYGLGSVDARDLVNLFDGLRLDLRMLIPANAGVAA